MRGLDLTNLDRGFFTFYNIIKRKHDFNSFSLEKKLCLVAMQRQKLDHGKNLDASKRIRISIRPIFFGINSWRIFNSTNRYLHQ
jgi:hypothetical protein